VRAGIGAILAILVTVAVQAQIQIGPGPFRGLPPAQPVATGTSSIEGAVTDSLTHNPIRKAMVNLNGRTSLVAATDVDGHFAFHQLPAGQYSLQAQSDQYPMAPFSVDLGRQATVSVAADEHKTGVGLSLVPGASLRGRIVDEEGNPMPQCTVSPIRYRAGDPNPATVGGVNSPTNDKGEYQIESVPAGKYYLMARCFQSIPMPHAFVRRDALAGVPRLTYPPLFYPASADLSGGTRVSLPAGTELTGIDFRMVSATGITVRGRVRPVLTGLTQITLAPKDKLLRPFQQQGARANQTTGEFQIQSVRPGSYEIEATAQAEGRSYSARVPIEVGASAPDSIDVLLQPAPQISGSVEIEGDPKPPLKNLHVALLQLDTQPFGPPPQAEVQSDGSFVTSASPGRWRLQVSGAPGYVKSVTLGDQEVSAASLEIGAAHTQNNPVDEIQPGRRHGRGESRRRSAGIWNVVVADEWRLATKHARQSSRIDDVQRSAWTIYRLCDRGSTLFLAAESRFEEGVGRPVPVRRSSRRRPRSCPDAFRPCRRNQTAR
jgi:hypothetical protein